jgi:hypothetical protein
MSVSSTLCKPPTYPAPQVLMTNQGNYIAFEQVVVQGLSQGDNNVTLPVDITKSPIAVWVGTFPDDVVLIVKSWSILSGTVTVVVNAAAAAASGCILNMLVPASG